MARELSLVNRNRIFQKQRYTQYLLTDGASSLTSTCHLSQLFTSEFILEYLLCHRSFSKRKEHNFTLHTTAM